MTNPIRVYDIYDIIHYFIKLKKYVLVLLFISVSFSIFFYSPPLKFITITHYNVITDEAEKINSTSLSIDIDSIATNLCNNRAIILNKYSKTKYLQYMREFLKDEKISCSEEKLVFDEVYYKNDDALNDILLLHKDLFNSIHIHTKNSFISKYEKGIQNSNILRVEKIFRIKEFIMEEEKKASKELDEKIKFVDFLIVVAKDVGIQFPIENVSGSINAAPGIPSIQMDIKSYPDNLYLAGYITLENFKKRLMNNAQTNFQLIELKKGLRNLELDQSNRDLFRDLDNLGIDIENLNLYEDYSDINLFLETYQITNRSNYRNFSISFIFFALSITSLFLIFSYKEKNKIR